MDEGNQFHLGESVVVSSTRSRVLSSPEPELSPLRDQMIDPSFTPGIHGIRVVDGRIAAQDDEGNSGSTELSPDPTTGSWVFDSQSELF